LEIGDAIALKVPVVSRIKTYQHREQPPVGFRKYTVHRILLSGKLRFDPIKRMKKPSERPLIRRLTRGKTATIDAIVDVFVDECVDAVYFCSLLRRIYINRH
jgi:hypothetical protein